MHLMNILTTVLLILDILCLVAAAVVFLVFLIIALVKKIRKQPAKRYVLNALIYAICCLLGCVVITWLLKMGISLTSRFRAL